MSGRRLVEYFLIALITFGSGHADAGDDEEERRESWPTTDCRGGTVVSGVQMLDDGSIRLLCQATRCDQWDRIDAVSGQFVKNVGQFGWRLV